MELIAERGGEWERALVHYSLDMAQGADENDFTLRCDPLPEPGTLVFVPGTGYGGVVDRHRVKASGGDVEQSAWGRTWEGMLASAIVCPDPGQAYLTLSGDVSDIMAALIERCGMGYAFQAPEPSGIQTTHTVNRYADLYSAICRLSEEHGMVPRFAKDDGPCRIRLAEPAVRTNDEVDDLRYNFEASDGRAPNHLICLGQGELEQRTVLHIYADEHGNVGGEQSMFGPDEWAEKYDYSSAESPEELMSAGIAKLRELNDEARYSAITAADGAPFAIGDWVEIVATGGWLDARARITKTVLTVDGETGDAKVSYQVAP